MTNNNEKGGSGRKWAQLNLQVLSQDIARKSEEDRINLGQDNTLTWGSEPGCHSNMSLDMLPMSDATQYIKGN